MTWLAEHRPRLLNYVWVISRRKGCTLLERPWPTHEQPTRWESCVLARELSPSCGARSVTSRAPCPVPRDARHPVPPSLTTPEPARSTRRWPPCLDAVSCPWGAAIGAKRIRISLLTLPKRGGVSQGHSSGSESHVSQPPTLDEHCAWERIMRGDTNLCRRIRLRRFCRWSSLLL
jgi:hypothetical protein